MNPGWGNDEEPDEELEGDAFSDDDVPLEEEPPEYHVKLDPGEMAEKFYRSSAGASPISVDEAREWWNRPRVAGLRSYPHWLTPERLAATAIALHQAKAQLMSLDAQVADLQRASKDLMRTVRKHVPDAILRREWDLPCKICGGDRETCGHFVGGGAR